VGAVMDDGAATTCEFIVSGQRFDAIY